MHKTGQEEDTPERSAGATSRPLVSLADVHCSYARGGHVVRALRGVSLHVDPGETVVIEGPARSGKSTLVRVIAGLERPGHGEVHVDGRRLSEMDDDELATLRRRLLGFVSGFCNFLATLDCAGNVALPLLLDGRHPDDARGRASALLGTLGIARCAGRSPHELPDTVQHLVGLARALIAQPALLLADEPAAEICEALTAVVPMLGTGVLMLMRDAAPAGRARTLHLRDGLLSEVREPWRVAG